MKRHAVDGAEILRAHAGHPDAGAGRRLRAPPAARRHRLSRRRQAVGAQRGHDALQHRRRLRRDAIAARSTSRRSRPTGSSQVLKRNDGTQFDQHLVRRFVQLVGIYPAGNLVRLNTGEIGGRDEGACARSASAACEGASSIAAGARLDLPYEVNLWEQNEEGSANAIVAPLDPSVGRHRSAVAALDRTAVRSPARSRVRSPRRRCPPLPPAAGGRDRRRPDACRLRRAFSRRLDRRPEAAGRRRRVVLERRVSLPRHVYVRRACDRRDRRLPASARHHAEHLVGSVGPRARSPARTTTTSRRCSTRGGTDPGASAARLLLPTLADELRAQRSGARVATVALKARSAIMLAGHGGDAVTWMDEDYQEWQTSTAFTPQRVAGVQAFLAANPVDADFGKSWTRRLPVGRVSRRWTKAKAKRRRAAGPPRFRTS